METQTQCPMIAVANQKGGVDITVRERAMPTERAIYQGESVDLVPASPRSPLVEIRSGGPAAETTGFDRFRIKEAGFVGRGDHEAEGIGAIMPRIENEVAGKQVSGSLINAPADRGIQAAGATLEVVTSDRKLSLQRSEERADASLDVSAFPTHSCRGVALGSRIGASCFSDLDVPAVHVLGGWP